MYIKVHYIYIYIYTDTHTFDISIKTTLRFFLKPKGQSQGFNFPLKEEPLAPGVPWFLPGSFLVFLGVLVLPGTRCQQL